MSDEPEQHDEAAIPDDAVEDLEPEESDQDVSGGSTFIKLDVGYDKG